MSKKILLISSSTVYGRGYLDHVEEEIRGFLGGVKEVLFVPFAQHDLNAYEAMAQKRFQKMGYLLKSIHHYDDMPQAARSAEAVFIGGGNTFRLLKGLYDAHVLEQIHKRVEAGIPYIGSSAGSIVACPTLKTTKDMPVVQPPSFDALRLVDFQISPHYLDPDPASTHMGETQEERINQFLEENDRAVIGLREGTLLRIENGGILLKGSTRARIFRRGHAPVEKEPGLRLDEFLHAQN
jgi:dipeptidase E